MDEFMGAIGFVLRTPFALIGIAFGVMWGIGYVLLLLLEAVAWVIFVVPFRFLGCAMGGHKQGEGPSQRFRRMNEQDVSNWQRTMGDTFGIVTEVSKWWTKSR